MRRDRGSAVVEFVAVVPLLLVVGLAVLQIALFAHARSVVSMAAGEAARAAAVSADPQRAARQKVEEILGGALGGVPLTGLQVRSGAVAGLEVVTVQVEVRPDLALLPGDIAITARGQALGEAGP